MIILAIEQYRGYAEVGARILGQNYLRLARQWPIDEKKNVFPGTEEVGSLSFVRRTRAGGLACA